MYFTRITSFIICLLLPQILLAETYRSSAMQGDSTLSGVFSLPLGERITALSSVIDCSIDIENSIQIKGICKVPLSSINVDSEPTKTKHFYAWATNKKIKPSQCRLELEFVHQLKKKLEKNLKQTFSLSGSFMICGRLHEKNIKEKITGSITLVDNQLHIRAYVKKFNRENYHVGPKWTDGWLSRIQALAPIVAKEGDITVNVIAKKYN